MPAENRISYKEKVKLEEAGWWQEPPALRLHAGVVAEIRVLEKHYEMD